MKRRQSGFAMVTAITLVGLVAVAALALTALLRADVNRTHAGGTDAQLRQLLLAGSDVARAAKGAGEMDVALPAELAGGKLVVRIEQEGERRRARVEAAVDEAQAGQTLVMERAGQGWRVIEARVE